MISSDPLTLNLPDDLRAGFASADSRGLRRVAEDRPLPPGFHFRTARKTSRGTPVIALWDWVHEGVDVAELAPVSPVFDAAYGDIVLLALSQKVPALQGVALPKGAVHVDGGLYCKTSDGLPIISDVDGHGSIFVVTAFAGFGIMAACGAGELIAQLVRGGASADDVADFSIARGGLREGNRERHAAGQL
jgi:sarcosine oxidase, subunit beta